MPSKGLQYNESVVLDSESRPWLGARLVELAKTTLPGKLLFNTSGVQFRADFKKACELAHLQVWKASPHVLRHAGPSHDCLSKARSLPDIQRRGRWMALSTERRYEQSSRVNARLLEIPESTSRYLEKPSEELENIIGQGCAPSVILRTLLARAGRAG